MSSEASIVTWLEPPPGGWSTPINNLRLNK